MRLIDADVIKIPKGFFEKVDNVPKFYEWLDDQPTVEAEPVKHGRWVPVAERLPENGSDVLGWRENFGIFPANYDHGRFFDCMFDRFADDVVAWMSLPEPYKGEQE